jgi:hypothetical protein
MGFVTRDMVPGNGGIIFPMNMVSPVNPWKYPSPVIRSIPVGDIAWPNESYNYLGVSTIGLLVVAIAVGRRRLRSIVSADHLPLTLLACALFMLSLSNNVWFADSQLISIKLPNTILNALSTFRSAGRLFWPVAYVLTCAAIASISWAFPGRSGLAVLAIALAVQYVDTRSLRSDVYSRHLRGFETPLISKEWNVLGADHEHLVVLPAWQCSARDTPARGPGYVAFARLALDQGLSVNSYYASRYQRAAMRYHCQIARVKVSAGEFDIHSAYVLNRDLMTSLIVRGVRPAHYCREVDGYYLCSRVPGKSGVDARLLSSILPEYRLGTRVDLSRGNAAPVAFGSGWHAKGAGGRWTSGESATLVFRPTERPVGGFLLSVTTSGLRGASLSGQRVAVETEGKIVGNWTVSVGGVYSVQIPAKAVDEMGLLTVTFHTPEATTPKALGINADERVLGIAVHALMLAAGSKP